MKVFALHVPAIRSKQNKAKSVQFLRLCEFRLLSRESRPRPVPSFESRVPDYGNGICRNGLRDLVREGRRVLVRHPPDDRRDARRLRQNLRHRHRGLFQIPQRTVPHRRRPRERPLPRLRRRHRANFQAPPAAPLRHRRPRRAEPQVPGTGKDKDPRST